MKKILLPLLLGCLLAATSCIKESTFNITNYYDFVTCLNGRLVSDSGASYTITENNSGSEDWKEEKSRFYILCDILNRDLQIRLKSVDKALIEYATELPETEKEPDDPIGITDSSLGGGYLNLVIQTYYNPDSNYARNISFHWKAEGEQLHFYVFYDGNHESPVYTSEDQLKVGAKVYSIPLEPIIGSQQYYYMDITFYELVNSAVERNTYRINYTN